MKIVGRITEWQLRKETPGKRTWMRYNSATDEIEIMEEWFNEVPLHEAQVERELAEQSVFAGDFRPLAVIPNSERSRAIREGWNNDDTAWRRWMNNSDNSRLRVTGGRV
jgi:hypothetical protein